MTSTSKPLAKSLHTVRVIANLAHYVMRASPGTTHASAIAIALVILERDTAPDPYGLARVALAQISGKEPPASPARPGEQAAVYAAETGVDYSTALSRCNMD